MDDMDVWKQIRVVLTSVSARAATINIVRRLCAVPFRKRTRGAWLPAR
jgi:hypothetical protein